MELSKQQKDIVKAPLTPMSVIACAGSGKTKTAVNRLAKVRADLCDERGYVALLSFSNVAVKTFKNDFSQHLSQSKVTSHIYSDRVVIETLDSFLTTNILRPHASETMGASVAPFLITGNEEFLNNKQYKFWIEPKHGNSRPVQPKEIGNITVRVGEEGAKFWLNGPNSLQFINNGHTVMNRLGKLGAYTHELGKFWACKTLLENDGLLKAFVNRYPHIIVDEAQDIDALHSCLLDILAEAGVTITLIGDPNQAIYEFAGADGEYLKRFDVGEANQSLPLSTNYRSVKNILAVSNNLSASNDIHVRETLHQDFGAYYCIYEKGKEKELIDTFVHRIDAMGISQESSAVLVRARKAIGDITGASADVGQGKTKLLALATIKRDIEKDYYSAFKLLVDCVVSLLNDPPDELSTALKGNCMEPDNRDMRQKLWQFLRCSETGLPAANLKAKSEWHGLLKSRLTSLLNEIQLNYGYVPVDRIGNKVAASKLTDEPFNTSGNLNLSNERNIRVDTVHQSKGESLDAVMYIASSDHAKKMLNGPDTELGRIGYVALTRAKNFFLLAVPSNAIKSIEKDLVEVGMKPFL